MKHAFADTRAQAAQILVQQLFAPKSAPISGVEYAVMYRFAQHVGGDVADVFDCGDDGVFLSQHLNELYLRNCNADGTESFASLFLALVEEDRRSMTYVSAGYESAMLVHSNGFSEVLPASGPIVGVLDTAMAQFGQRTVPLAPGTTLLAISDGVTEARMGCRRFGLARIRSIVSERAGAPLDELSRDILDAARRQPSAVGILRTTWQF